MRVKVESMLRPILGIEVIRKQTLYWMEVIAQISYTEYKLLGLSL